MPVDRENPMARSMSVTLHDDDKQRDLRADVQNALGTGGSSKDTNDIDTENKEFMHNNYWRVEENSFDLDDLIKDADL